MKINKIVITILFFLVMLSSAEAYLFRTAAIDGPSYCEDGLYVYINPSTINVGGVIKTGTPAANFNVNANTVYDITYSASGYQTDTDDFYFDAGLPTCSGTTCHLTTSHFDTHCTYSLTYKDWTCVVTDTQTEQWISFIYNKNDPTYGEVIRILNSMYPGECMPDEEDCKQCGYSNIGECKYGTQTRVCKSDYTWGSWSSCVGAVYPVTEICDGKDNDCDGLTDEGGVCWVCTPGEKQTKQCGETDVGECSFGTQTRTCDSEGQWGSWSSCVGAVYPVTEICDGKDNDCDGLTDEGGVCWVCTPGE
ncbi:MAG: MopE-related protein, partial [Candidatus Nanoarchaeia archaeon]|nr:MopE-related protein [Candidatus Nanoarchaeia archaeon]